MRILWIWTILAKKILDFLTLHYGQKLLNFSFFPFLYIYTYICSITINNVFQNSQQSWVVLCCANFFIILTLNQYCNIFPFIQAFLMAVGSKADPKETHSDFLDEDCANLGAPWATVAYKWWDLSHPALPHVLPGLGWGWGEAFVCCSAGILVGQEENLALQGSSLQNRRCFPSGQDFTGAGSNGGTPITQEERALLTHWCKMDIICFLYFIR